MRETPGQREPSAGDSLGRKAISFLGWWAVLFGIWFLLVTSLAHPEVAAGAFAAVLAGIVALGIRTRSRARYRPRLAWLTRFTRLPASILCDTGVLVAVLWRQLARRRSPASAFRLVSFPATQEGPEPAAWRAFAITVTSVAPNTYVVGIDRERGVALVHQLAPEPPRRLHETVIGATPSEPS